MADLTVVDPVIKSSAAFIVGLVEPWTVSYNTEMV